MKQFLSGSGVDTTATVLAALRATSTVYPADLYLIGEDDDPRALWLTNWETPLAWPIWGTFRSTNIRRGNITSKVGLEAPVLDLEWSPLNQAITSSLETASPYQLARLGQFDNWRVRVWRCYMPTPGDANTWGAAEWFAGWIGDVKIEDGKITFSVNNYLYVLDQKVPTAVIEPTNTVASYSAGAPPAGYDVMPQFSIHSGSTPTILICDQISPHAGTIPGTNALANGYVVFNGDAGMTLRGAFSIIAANSNVIISGVHHTQIQIYSPLPWAPTPGVDTFYVSQQAPITQDDGDYFGFPYVPAPETAA